MGRIFEVRKHAMFARWNRMAKQFARVAKDINMAVKAGGPDPAANPTLRRIMQNARAVNMPKDKVEAAIKRASGRDATHYMQVHVRGLCAARRCAADRDRHRQSDPHGRARAQHHQQARRQPRHHRQRQLPVPARWACSGSIRPASIRMSWSST